MPWPAAPGVWIYRGGPYEIAEKLKEIKKRRKNIKIRLYIEGQRNTSIRNRVTAEILKDYGVQVKYGATHAKGFCIDQRYVLFGSTNLTNQSLRKNHETNVLVDRPEVTEGFMEYFEHLWRGGKHGGISLKPPMYADGDFEDLLLDMINSAQKNLDFSIYFFDHKGIRDALVQAYKRGVKVKGFIHDHGSFALSYVRRTRRNSSTALCAPERTTVSQGISSTPAKSDQPKGLETSFSKFHRRGFVKFARKIQVLCQRLN